MNPDLLALVEALQALREATTAAAKAEALGKLEALIQACLERNPNLSRDSLERTVGLAHARWLKADERLRQRRLTT